MIFNQPAEYNRMMIPSGKHSKSYWTWPFIVDLPIKNDDCPKFSVNVYQGETIQKGYSTRTNTKSDSTNESEAFNQDNCSCYAEQGGFDTGEIMIQPASIWSFTHFIH